MNRCNKKATHISTSWGFRACKQHAKTGLWFSGEMIPYRRELDVPCKYESDFQRCDKPLNEIPAGYLTLIKHNPKTGYQLWQNPFGEKMEMTAHAVGRSESCLRHRRT